MRRAAVKAVDDQIRAETDDPAVAFKAPGEIDADDGVVFDAVADARAGQRLEGGEVERAYARRDLAAFDEAYELQLRRHQIAVFGREHHRVVIGEPRRLVGAQRAAAAQARKHVERHIVPIGAAAGAA